MTEAELEARVRCRAILRHFENKGISLDSLAEEAGCSASELRSFVHDCGAPLGHGARGLINLLGELMPAEQRERDEAVARYGESVDSVTAMDIYKDGT